MPTLYAPFDRLETAEDLERAIAIPSGLIGRVLQTPAESLYERHRIPKRNRARGHREVVEIKDDEWCRALGSMNRHLAGYLREVHGLPGKWCHGFVMGRSIKSNAWEHLGAEGIVRADIVDFFATIQESRVRDRLQALGLKGHVAEMIARFACVDGRLALGIPISPTLANLVADGIDRDLGQLAETRDIKYTRYADDLTFSGPPGRLPSSTEIATVLAAHGFRLAEDKFVSKKRGQAVVVTGLTVFDRGRPRVPKRFKKRIRMELHYASKHGLLAHSGRAGYSSVQQCCNRIDGAIQFLRGIERELGDRLNAMWQAILVRERRGVVWIADPSSAPAATWLFVDESVFETAGVRVLALALVALRDRDAAQSRIREFALGLMKDSFRAGTGGPGLPTGILHFKDLSHEVRSDLAKLVAALPVRAFVAYSLLQDEKDYEDAWMNAYRTLLNARMPALDGAAVEILVEQNSRVSRSRIEGVASALHDSLTSSRARRPSSLSTQVVAKDEEPCLALPDTLLGVFKDYAILRRPETPDLAAAFDAGKRPSVEVRFERLREKFRLIHSGVSGRRYGPTRPFVPWPNGVPT